jgi:hypothetical protein
MIISRDVTPCVREKFVAKITPIKPARQPG